MTNQERYTIIENIYLRGGVMQLDVDAMGVISSDGIPYADATELFVVIASVALGINDVDPDLFDKMADEYSDITATLPQTIHIDLKGANSNVDNPADAKKYFLNQLSIDLGGGVMQDYIINRFVDDLMQNNTGITRVQNTDDLFVFLEQIREAGLIEALNMYYADNYLVYYEEENEYLIAEVI